MGGKRRWRSHIWKGMAVIGPIVRSGDAGGCLTLAVSALILLFLSVLLRIQLQAWLQGQRTYVTAVSFRGSMASQQAKDGIELET